MAHSGQALTSQSTSRQRRETVQRLSPSSSPSGYVPSQASLKTDTSKRTTSSQARLKRRRPSRWSVSMVQMARFRSGVRSHLPESALGQNPFRAVASITLPLSQSSRSSREVSHHKASATQTARRQNSSRRSSIRLKTRALMRRESSHQEASRSSTSL